MTDAKFSIEKMRSDVLAVKVNTGCAFTLTKDAVIEALNGFLAGLIDKEAIADWAEFFDVNEDIELESDEVLPDVLFELASPEINGWLDEIRAQQLIALLSR